MIWRAIRQSASTPVSLKPFKHGVGSGRSLTTSIFDSNVAGLLASPPKAPHESITAVGWIRTLRKQKRITFLELGDGSTAHNLQAVLNPSQSGGLTTGTAVAIRGNWQSAPLGSEQANELHADDVQMYGSSDETFPIQKKYHSSEYLRTIPHLRLRTPLNAVVARLHLEAFVHEHPRVWTLSPTFRAEKSDTPRHVSEFMMLEVEVRTESLQEIIALVESMIREVVMSLQKSNILEELVFARRKAIGDDIAEHRTDLQTRWDSLTSEPWPRVNYAQALVMLKNAHVASKAAFVHEPSGQGLQLEHERWLVKNVGHGQPIFVTHYPRDSKPFYMLPTNPEDGSENQAMCFDLLLPEVCEVVGGSLREHRLEPLIQSMQARGMEQDTSKLRETLNWYLDLRRYGSVPHGGFGLGIDRLLSYLSGVPNIKDVVQWPRYYGRCDC